LRIQILVGDLPNPSLDYAGTSTITPSKGWPMNNIPLPAEAHLAPLLLSVVSYCNPNKPPYEKGPQVVGIGRAILMWKVFA